METNKIRQSPTRGHDDPLLMERRDRHSPEAMFGDTSQAPQHTHNNNNNNNNSHNNTHTQNLVDWEGENNTHQKPCWVTRHPHPPRWLRRKTNTHQKPCLVSLPSWLTDYVNYPPPPRLKTRHSLETMFGDAPPLPPPPPPPVAG